MTLLIGLGAVNTGNNLLYLLISALLGFMAVSGVVGKRNIERLRVDIELPDEIYDGLETLVTVRIANRRRWLPAFLLRVTLLDRDLTIPVIARRDAVSASLPVVFHGRGRRIVEAARLCSIFPINFFVRCRLLPMRQRATVFPALRYCRSAGASGRRKRQGEYRLPSKGYEGDLDRITDYRGSEPLKMIHWKLSARHDRLMVKELSATGAEPVILDPAEFPGDQEARLRCAAFLVDRCVRRNIPVGLRLGGRLLPAAVGRNHKLRLLTELAIHGQD